MTDLLYIFFAVFLSVMVPVIGLVYANKAYRPLAFVYVPIGIAFQFLAMGLVAALLYQPLEFGWVKFALVIFLSTLFVAFILERIHRRSLFIPTEVHASRLLAVIFAIALVGILDSIVIASFQGYHDGMVYFRPPFNSDPQRNVFLINALIRHDGSPFFPGAGMLYQLFWYHLAAVFVSLSKSPNHYGLAMGVAVATSYFLFVVILWSVYSARPLLGRAVFAIPLLIILFSHADIYFFIKGLIFSGAPCIVADASCDILLGPERLYEPFSIKNASLVSPQHALFALGLAAFLGGSCYRPFKMFSQVLLEDSRPYVLSEFRRNVASPVFGAALLIMMFLVSPILSAFILPFFILFESIVLIWKRHWLDLARYMLMLAGLLLVALVVYRIAFDESAVRLYWRPYLTGLESLRLFKSFFEDWTRLPAVFLTPVALVAVLGISGALVILLSVIALHQKQASRFMVPAVFVLFAATYYTNFVLGHAEIRRHVSIVIPVIAVFALISLMSDYLKRPLLRYGIFLLAAISLPLHGYYLYSYTQKPSLASSTIPWSDYVCMNGVLNERYRNQPALAAEGGGLRFPLVFEATSSYDRFDDAAIHARLRDHSSRIIDFSRAGVPVTELTGNLGIRLVVWGPVEDEVWGMTAKTKMLGENTPLERCGSVGLYRVDMPPYQVNK